MRLTVRCPVCDSGLSVEAVGAPEKVTCGGCGQTLSLLVTGDLLADRQVDACPLCRGRDFYIRKDFDPKLGLAFVITGVLISSSFYWFGLDLVAYGVLGLAALIDLVVYGRLDFLTVCYRCHTEFRGAYKPTASVFDLATADELELEWGREWAEFKKRN